MARVDRSRNPQFSMKFKHKYERLPVSFTPQEKEVESGLTQTGRMFTCFACEDVTGFRVEMPDTPEVPCCSDECRDVIKSWSVTIDLPATPLDGIEVADNERSPSGENG